MTTQTTFPFITVETPSMASMPSTASTPSPQQPTQNLKLKTKNSSPASASSALNPTPAFAPPTSDLPPSPHPYSSFAQFTPDQLLQISAWLDDHTYEEVVDLIKEKYHRPISKSAVQRFYVSTAFKKHLIVNPDTAAAAAQILEYAATGRPNFTEAGLRVLEETSFQLSATCHRQPADLDTLNRITTIICRQKNTAVRERHATVQETKCALRAQELELKAKSAARLPINSKLKTKNSKRRSADGDSLELSGPDSENGFTCENSDLIDHRDFPSTPFPTLPPEIVKQTNRISQLVAAGEITIIHEPDHSSTYLYTRDRSRLYPVDPAVLFSTFPCDLPAASPGNADLQSAVSPICNRPASPIENAQCSIPNAQSSSHPLPSTKNSELKTQNFSPSALSASSALTPPPLSPVPAESLAATVDAYTVRRAQEYWAYRRTDSDPDAPAYRRDPEYITKHRHCPCGHATPCPVHENEETYGRFPKWFWSRSPHSPAYAACLRDRGLPYREPTEFL